MSVQGLIFQTKKKKRRTNFKTHRHNNKSRETNSHGVRKKLQQSNISKQVFDITSEQYNPIVFNDQFFQYIQITGMFIVDLIHKFFDGLTHYFNLAACMKYLKVSITIFFLN